MVFAYLTLSTSSSFLMMSSRAAFGLPMRARNEKELNSSWGSVKSRTVIGDALTKKVDHLFISLVVLTHL